MGALLTLGMDILGGRWWRKRGCHSRCDTSDWAKARGLRELGRNRLVAGQPPNQVPFHSRRWLSKIGLELLKTIPMRPLHNVAESPVENHTEM